MDGPLNENIENDPMQSSMVRPLERFRKNILTRRANHRHIFIVARIKPAPENPPRAFSIRQYAVKQDMPERAEPGRCSKPNWLTAKTDPADRRAPGEDDGQAEPESTIPRHCASHPSSTCLQTLKANPALSARARSYHGLTRSCPQIPVGDSSCLITLWCR